MHFYEDFPLSTKIEIFIESIIDGDESLPSSIFNMQN